MHTVWIKAPVPYLIPKLGIYVNPSHHTVKGAVVSRTVVFDYLKFVATVTKASGKRNGVLWLIDD
jgi:hypothetical protein